VGRGLPKARPTPDSRRTRILRPACSPADEPSCRHALSLICIHARAFETLSIQPLQGYGIAKAIRRRSGDALDIGFGSQYPALKRLEIIGWIAAKWETSDSNRQAKYYRLTPSGRKQLQRDIRNGRALCPPSRRLWDPRLKEVLHERLAETEYPPIAGRRKMTSGKNSPPSPPSRDQVNWATSQWQRRTRAVWAGCLSSSYTAICNIPDGASCYRRARPRGRRRSRSASRLVQAGAFEPNKWPVLRREGCATSLAIRR